jgi:hypothetical protein
MSEGGIYDFTWNSTTRVVADGYTSHSELLVDSGADTLYLEGRYRASEDDEWMDVTVIFNLDGETERVVSRQPGSGALGVVEIPPGATFQAYRAVVTSDGRVRFEPGTVYNWPEWGLTWFEANADSGEYETGVVVTTYGGGTAFDSFTTEVNNEPDEGICEGLELNHLITWNRNNTGIGTISFEWTHYEGAYWYRLRIYPATDDIWLPVEYLVQGGLGQLVPVSAFAMPNNQFLEGEYTYQIFVEDENNNEICHTVPGSFLLLPISFSVE